VTFKSEEAFNAIASTMNLGSVGYENAVNAEDERLIGSNGLLWIASATCCPWR
jgi:hypothetical protein